MNDLRVNLTQWDLKWEKPADNYMRVEKLLSTKLQATDLIVFPEMFSTGFSMNAIEISEEHNGETACWMKKIAQDFNCAVAGSVATQIGSNVYNRLLFITPSESFHYDKRHLFRMAGEHKNYQAGNERVIVEWRGWRVKLEVCYDLRFPAFSRNLDDYDLLLNVANWPAKRAPHWTSLLIARAIENQVCVVGVNRVGRDGNGHLFSGDSVAINPLGETLVQMGKAAGCEQVTLNYQEMIEYRRSFPCHKDADRFTLHLQD